ncbi:hypothetical protein TSTA_065770 [Talaromyces stipitatus ATCC 10500]|uniref:Reverse transcriptase n=1 Tax=Talaromyces stipitatus (strain ATCC 10500 / CBS 375.48 / QM 6759 / NRRL 1006) TaxID=441959 RepID=B8LV74_TALSN|nr:uncharacterized protein TSTA_065770 [Talaromyces stipitatus ATCC 10500]EED23124.1 hypothetical protein TSTA_065770 [Talaromyces stipitatus ATCC 10500]
MPRGWGQDKAAARAPKRLASRYYQLKTGHAPIGAYLHRIQARDSPECKACGALRETVSHILFECRGRHKARRELYRGLAKAGVPLPTAAEDNPEARLLSEPKATIALLQFVGSADLFGDKELRRTKCGFHHLIQISILPKIEFVLSVTLFDKLVVKDILDESQELQDLSKDRDGAAEEAGHGSKSKFEHSEHAGDGGGGTCVAGAAAAASEENLDGWK